MSKIVHVGQMHTRIRILRPVDQRDGAGNRNPQYENIYPDGRAIRCQWQSAFGTEALQAQSLGIPDPATIVVRYDPRITADCVVETGSGAQLRRYEIISVPNDLGNQHRFLEIRLKGRRRSM